GFARSRLKETRNNFSNAIATGLSFANRVRAGSLEGESESERSRRSAVGRSKDRPASAKELVARQMHSLRRQRSGLFVALTARRKRLSKRPGNGTLLLDEVADLST